ncbi:hypothetical protein MMC10_005085 [Thelotrema lepadinum]|nr:hypothetical protein [Thelotrema lepadinum]
MIQGNQGSLATRSVQKSVLDKVHWVNLCKCSGLKEDCGDDFESIFVLEVKGMRGSRAGFTLTYNQHGSGQLIKISNSADWSLMDTTAAHGSHWKAPLLELQKGAMPTATLLSTFSSVFPSLTASAAPSAYTWTTGHVNTVANPSSPTTASPHIPSSPASQQSVPPAPSTPPTALLTVQGQEGWRHRLHTTDTVAVFEHSLSALRSKAQDAAQTLVASLHSMHHCSKDEGPSIIKKQGDAPNFLYDIFATPSNTARATIPTPSDASMLSDSEFAEPITHDRHVTRRQAILAFQISALATIILSFVAAMFALVRRNPRLRAEIAARHEERRNRRLYRKAACRYRWQQAFNRFKGFKVTWGRQDRGECITDGNIPADHSDDGIDWNGWHEKRMSSENDSVVVPSTAGVREGLRELRKAHRLVDSMMSAEEGSCGIASRPNRHQRSWSDSGNSEKTAPPPYEEEEVYIADGMRYVRHVTGSTPDSSVIDTSSRSSMADSDSESEKD